MKTLFDGKQPLFSFSSLHFMYQEQAKHYAHPCLASSRINEYAAFELFLNL